MELTKEQLLEIEQQLRHPKGEKGIAVGNNLHRTNIGMTKSSIDLLNINEGETIVELGHGNCCHLEDILDKADNIRYLGFEISETMQLEALKLLENFESTSSSVSFELYNGKKFDLPDATIDKLFTVNTLYFWEDAVSFLREISRVLKKQGVCIITFAQKEFMQTLPFVNKKFKLYNTNEFELLIDQSPFFIKEMFHKTEQVESKTGALVERNYSIAILKQR